MSEETKYTDPTGLDKVDYDQSQVSPEVKKHVKNVRTKMYGRHVRESIARAIEFIDLTAQSALSFAKKAFSKSEDTENRLDNQIRDLTSDSEIIDLRYSKMLKKTFNVLKDRGDFWDECLVGLGTNVKWFGAIPNDPNFDNSESFMKALDSNDHILIPKGTYYFKKGIVIRKSNVVIESLGAELIATENMENFIDIGHKNAPSYISEIEFKGVLSVDSNLKAKNGIFVMNAKDINLDSITSSNSLEYDFLVDLDKNNTSEWPSITNEVYLKGCRATNSDWGNENKESTGLRINTSDCFVFDFKTIHKTKAIFNGGNNFYDKIHSWIINLWQMQNGAFFTTTSTATLHNAYSDTYPVDYEILNKVNMSMLNCFSYYNQSYYTLEKIANKELPVPIKFKFKDWQAATSNIRATNCTLSGAEKGGGLLTNRKEYPLSLDLVNCNLQYLYNVPLEKGVKDNLKLNYEDGDIKIDKASKWVNKKTQLGAVRIKPLNLVVEDMDGDFSKKDRWNIKWTSSTKPDTDIKYENSSMYVTGSGRIPVSIKYQVPSKTSIFVRFQIESNRAMSMVALLNRKSVAEHIINFQGGYRVENFLINLDEPGELELTFWVDSKHASETGSFYKVKEFMLIDTFRRGVGNVLETSFDLKERLSKIGFVLKEKLLPLPKDVDFYVKSYKKSHINRLVVPEKSETFQYLAFRSIDGLNVKGIEGSNPFKSFVFYQSVTESMKNSLETYFISKVTPISKLGVKSGNTFATNMSVNGAWKTLKNWHSSSAVRLELTNDSQYLTFSTLLADDNKEVYNNCLISDIVLSSSSEPNVYSTSYLTQSETWTYLPIFKDGYIGVMTDSEYFADVEVLHS